MDMYCHPDIDVLEQVSIRKLWFITRRSVYYMTSSQEVVIEDKNLMFVMIFYLTIDCTGPCKFDQCDFI